MEPQVVAATVADPALTDFMKTEVLLPFILISLAFLAVISAVKRGIDAAGQTWLMDHPAWKFGLEVGQPLLGGLMGAAPGVFPEDLALSVRIFLGVIAGFLSPQIYKYVLKKYLPGIAMSSDHDKRIHARHPAPAPTPGPTLAPGPVDPTGPGGDA